MHFITTKDHVEPFLANYTKVTLEQSKLNQIHAFVDEVIKTKQKESHHRIDGHNEYKRFYTGTLGEAALETFLGIEIIDWTVGNSNTFNIPDLNSHSLNVGIKTVEYGKFPIIHKRVKRPEIINIKISENSVLVCGLATTSKLRLHQDDNLILSPSLRNRGTKTGFHGFFDLKQFNNLSELKQLCMHEPI